MCCVCVFKETKERVGEKSWPYFLLFLDQVVIISDKNLFLLFPVCLIALETPCHLTARILYSEGVIDLDVFPFYIHLGPQCFNGPLRACEFMNSHVYTHWKLAAW